MGTDLHDLTAAYALNALDEFERGEYEEHLATCERCRAELADLRDAAAALAYAVESPEPPEELRERIVAQARAERDNVVPLRPRPRLTYALGALAAAASVAAVAVAVWAAGVASERDELRRAADPHARVLPIRAGGAATGHLVIAPDNAATLVVDSEPAPAGKDFEVWVIEGGRPLRAGLYEGGRDVVKLDRAVPRGATVAVTLERDGGVDAPTTKPLFAVRS